MFGLSLSARQGCAASKAQHGTTCCTHLWSTVGTSVCVVAMKSLLLVVAACVVVAALPVAMAQLDVPADVLQDAVRQAYMSSPKRSPTLANMLNRATSSVLPTRDIGARMLAEAASPTASPWCVVLAATGAAV